MSFELEKTNENSLEGFKVYVRARPISEKEISLIEKIYSNSKSKSFQRNILIKEDNLLFVIDPDCMDYNVKNYLIKREEKKRALLSMMYLWKI
jgi:hypothetical protein